MTLEIGRGQVLVHRRAVRARASRRSCAASITSSRSTRGRLYVDGDLIGYRERGGKLHEMPPRDAAKQRRDIGMVFQHFNLFPHRTALGNIMESPMQVKGVKKDKARARAWTCSTRWDWRTRRRPTRPSCRADNSSGWRSRELWRWIPS